MKCNAEANSYDWFSHMTHQFEALEPPLQDNRIVWWSLIACKQPKNGRGRAKKIANVSMFCHF